MQIVDFLMRRFIYIHVDRNKPVCSSAGRTKDTVVPLTAEYVIPIGSPVNSVEIVFLADDSVVVIVDGRLVVLAADIIVDD